MPDKYFSIRYQHGGKRIEEGLGWATEGWTPAKAFKTLCDLKEAAKTGTGPTRMAERRKIAAIEKEKAAKKEKAERRGNMTFGEIAKMYIDWAKDNKKSWKDDVQRYKNHLEPVFASLPLKQISALQLEGLKRDLGKKGLALATIKHCLVLFRQIVNRALDWKLYDGVNPIKNVKLPGKLNNKRTRFLSHEETGQLLEELKKRSLQVHDQALLSLHCGLRFGEIAALTFDDLDLKQELMYIRDPKGKESRQAFMTPEVKALLAKKISPSSVPTDLLFSATNGKKQKSVSNAFDRAVKKLGLNNGIEDRRTKVVFHTLRHTFASWLAIQGTPLYTIKELMGHKTIEMTERYAHLIPDHKRQAVTALADGFRQAEKQVAS